VSVRVSRFARRRRKLDRLVHSVIELFMAAPDAGLVLSSDEYKQALYGMVTVSVECDDLMRKWGTRLWQAVGRAAADDICNMIVANIDDYTTFKDWFVVCWHTPIKRPRSTVTLRQLVAEHGRLMKRMRGKAMELDKRVELLLQLMQLQMIFVGYMW
jgi:hypothetical protein